MIYVSPIMWNNAVQELDIAINQLGYVRLIAKINSIYDIFFQIGIFFSLKGGKLTN